MPCPPKHVQFDAAAAVAHSQATAQRAGMTVCLDVRGGTRGYTVLTSQEYAVLRENDAADDLTPVASVLPNGGVEVHIIPRSNVP
jgi:hypothetical protein